MNGSMSLGVDEGDRFVLWWKKVWGEGWSIHLHEQLLYTLSVTNVMAGGRAGADARAARTSGSSSA